MGRRKELLSRVYITTAIVIVSAFLLSFKVVKINVAEGERWREKGDELYLKYFPVQAERGDVLAWDGSLLLTSLPYFDIRMDLRADGLTDEVFAAGVDSLAYFLSKEINQNWTQRKYRDHLIKARKRNNRYLLLKKDVSYAKMERVKKYPILCRGANKGGLILEEKNIRARPFGELGARTIGSVREHVQPVGLEGFFDNKLKGQEGKRLMRQLRGSTWIPVELKNQIEAKRGADVITTLDVRLQDIAHDALLHGLKTHNGLYGTAVVMEVKTGAIRAMANLIAHEGQWRERQNFAVGHALEPGSTFKLASVMAMLEDGYVTPETTVDLGKGYARFYNRDLYDSEMHGLNKSTMRVAFEKSSNVGIAKLTNKAYGKTRKAGEFIARLKQFGLNRTTGIEIPGEGAPKIKEAYNTEQRWSGTTIPWMSFGYELELTPLQTLTFYNSVANDGRRMRPYLATSIQRDGQAAQEFKPRVEIEKIASDATIKTAQELLRSAVTVGTGRKQLSDRVTFAGKTGTTVVEYYKPGADRKKYHSSFVGYFPAENPKYSCIVLIYDPKNGQYYGSTVALPVFRDIAERTMALGRTKLRINDGADATMPETRFSYGADVMKLASALEIPAVDSTDSEWVRVQNDSGLKITARDMEGMVLPDLSGMGLRDAIFLLENAGLEVSVDGIGRVDRQSIKAGTKVTKGTRIKLSLA